MVALRALTPVIAVLMIAGCTEGTVPGGRSPSRPSAGGGTASPTALSDQRLAMALLPTFEGVEPGVPGAGRRQVERVSEPRGARSQMFFAGRGGVPETACRRWAGGLRVAARDARSKDPDARIAGEVFPPHEGTVVAVALLVAQPPLLDALSRDVLAGCRSTETSDEKQVTGEKITGSAQLGDRVQAWRILDSGKAATWVKEVQFRDYLLQVTMAAVPGGQPGDPVSASRLDAISAQAYEHARRTLSGVAAPASPAVTAFPSYATEPPGDLADGRLDEAVLARFRDTRLDPDQPYRREGDSSFGPGLSDEPVLKKTAFIGVDRSSPCAAWAEGVWTAAAMYPKADSVLPQHGISALYGDNGFFVTEFLLWATPEMIDAMTTPAPPGTCRSFTHKIDGKTATVTASPVKAAKVGEASWAYKITTSIPGDSPALVKWFRFGPYLAEVRIGTIGRKANDQVNIKTLDAAAQAAYTQAVQTLT